MTVASLLAVPADACLHVLSQPGSSCQDRLVGEPMTDTCNMFMNNKFFNKGCQQALCLCKVRQESSELGVGTRSLLANVAF